MFRLQSDNGCSSFSFLSLIIDRGNSRQRNACVADTAVHRKSVLGPISRQGLTGAKLNIHLRRRVSG